MRKLKVQPLSAEAFAPYGAYVNLVEPSGERIGETPFRFFRDPLTMTFFGTAAAFSVCEVDWQEKKIITRAEYHDTTAEGILPLDGDVILHVAPATNRIAVPEKTVAFYLPRGTMVRLNAGVWHLAPLPVRQATVHNLIVLPERTYANDCKIVDFDESDYIEIIE